MSQQIPTPPTGTDAVSITAKILDGHKPKQPSADERKATDEKFATDFAARMKQDGQARARRM